MPFWLALFFGNAFSTTLLGWVVVPLMSKVFSWWLNPSDSAVPTRLSGMWITLAETALIVCLYLFLFLVFSHLP